MNNLSQPYVTKPSSSDKGSKQGDAGAPRRGTDKEKGRPEKGKVPPDGTGTPAAVPAICAPATAGKAPEYTLLYARLLGLSDSWSKLDKDDWSSWLPSAPQWRWALYVRFGQVWRLTDVRVGDLSTSMGLAPGETLQLEFRSSQRTTFEEKTLTSTEELTSEESTTVDKEVMNAARSAAHDQKWHVDGQGGINLGSWLKIQAGAGYEKSLKTTTQESLQHITEATKKSSHSLKTLQKIEVRGVTETAVENRIRRTISNPYRDRSLAVKAFQLVKNYQVTIGVHDVRPALLLEVDPLRFDERFVLANADFLNDALLDSLLLGDLSLAVEGARLPAGLCARAGKVAALCLHYLFEQPGVFDFGSMYYAGTTDPLDSSDPATSFDVSLHGEWHWSTGGVGFNPSAYETATGFDPTNEGRGGVEASHYFRDTDLPQLYVALHVLRNAYFTQSAADAFGEKDSPPGEAVIHLTKAIYDACKTRWDNLTADNRAHLLDIEGMNEVFRRLPGFFAMYEDMLQPVLPALDTTAEAQATATRAALALSRLTGHLEERKEYYTQEYLAYVARKTKNQFVIQVAEKAQDAAQATLTGIDLDLDPQRAFLHRRQIVVPGIRSATEDEMAIFVRTVTGQDYDLALRDIDDVSEEIDLPGDGVHLEVAPGLCTLEDLPPALPDVTGELASLVTKQKDARLIGWIAVALSLGAWLMLLLRQ